MKKNLLILTVILLSISVFSQQESQKSFIEQSLVVNVEVPVRVFKDDEFIDNLTIEDFEVFENGIPQKIEAVYLVKKRTIERSDEKKRFMPETSRNFYLFFEISDYSAKMNEAIDHFIQNVYLPGDNLFVITSLKTYRLKKESLQRKPKERVAKDLKNLIRRDTMIGDAEYRESMKELEGLARTLSALLSPNREVGRTFLDSETGDFEVTRASGIMPTLARYTAHLQKMETLRKIDELKMLDLAKHLKNQEGQKYVFVFYQREFIPQIDQRILTQLAGTYDDTGGEEGGQDSENISFFIADIVKFHNRVETDIDIERVKQAYADAATSIHFLFISRPREHVPGVYFQESSTDVYAAFTEMARASGGFMASSANPHSLFQKAINSSENYYLLYYAPKDYVSEGKFKSIDVRVKDRDYKVIHRLGYFAN